MRFAVGIYEELAITGCARLGARQLRVDSDAFALMCCTLWARKRNERGCHGKDLVRTRSTCRPPGALLITAFVLAGTALPHKAAAELIRGGLIR